MEGPISSSSILGTLQPDFFRRHLWADSTVSLGAPPPRREQPVWSTCSCAGRSSRPQQWSAERAPDRPDGLQGLWDLWRNLNGRRTGSEHIRVWPQTFIVFLTSYLLADFWGVWTRCPFQKLLLQTPAWVWFLQDIYWSEPEHKRSSGIINRRRNQVRSRRALKLRNTTNPALIRTWGPTRRSKKWSNLRVKWWQNTKQIL